MPETRCFNKNFNKKLGLVENCCYFSTYWFFKNDLISNYQRSTLAYLSNDTKFITTQCLFVKIQRSENGVPWKKNRTLINFAFLFHASSRQKYKGEKKSKEIVKVYI